MGVKKKLSRQGLISFDRRPGNITRILVGNEGGQSGGPHRGIAAIVPVAGRPGLVQEAIHSLLSGRMVPDRVIVVVDSVGLESRADEEAVRKMSSPVPIDILHSEGRGPGAARNMAARHAAEEWLAFLDSDDLWSREKLEAQMRAVRKRPHLHAMASRETWIKEGREIPQPMALRPFAGRRLSDAFFHCRFSMSSLLIRREVFLSLGGFDETFIVCEDFDFILRFLSLHPVGLVDDPHVIKRSGNWPQLSSTPGLDRERVRALLKCAKSAVLDPHDRSQLWKAVREKARIFCTGARRRGREREAVELEEEMALALSEHEASHGGISLAV